MIRLKFVKLLFFLTAAAVVGFGMDQGSVSANGFDDMKLIQTVYHVSVDGEEIGIVSDQSAIEPLIDQLAEKAEQRHPGVVFTIAQNLTYKADKVFRPQTDTDDLLAALKNKITLRAKAVQLVVSGEELGYFKSKEEAEKVLQSFKQQYVPGDVLKSFSEKTNIQSPRKPDTPFKSIKLSKEVTYKEAKVKPEQLLTVKQGVKLLQKGTVEEQVYKVKKGDSLDSIAGKYDLSVKELLKINTNIGEDDVLSIGTELKVKVPEPFLKVIATKTVTKKEKIPFETEVKENDEILKGKEETIQKGNNGTKNVTYEVTKANGKLVNKKVIEENVLEKPKEEIVVKGTKVIPSRGTGSLGWPAVGGYISSYLGPRWGSLHKGIDIARPSRRAILAADNGRVVSAGYDDGGYGNRIVINHHNGMRTTYSHLSSIDVSAGETVSKGQQIGVMGATGNVTGVHLHFEVYKNGQLKNPMDYLN